MYTITNLDVRPKAGFILIVLLVCNTVQTSRSQACQPSCQYGGICLGNGCICPPGLTGLTCTNVNCDNYPCLNGGTCSRGLIQDQDTCQCPDGFVLPFCTTSCLTDPCQNGGTCSDDVCSCSQGFAGPTCQSAIAVYLSPLEVSVIEGNVGDDISVQIRVCRQPSTLATNAIVGTLPDSANISLDFVFMVTPVAIPIGQVCEPVDISIVSDMTIEPIEVFHVVLFVSQVSQSVHIVPGQRTATVTIIDNDEDTEPPVINNCPGDMSFRIPAGTSSTNVSWVRPTASDNYGDVTLTSSHQPGGTFFLGQTTVNYTATDGAENTVLCQFVVTVRIAIDPCASNPCQNGATCFAGTGFSFFCNCVEGFTGPICDIVTNPCDPDPCLNNGNCIVLNNELFLCSCQDGFTGQNCEIVNSCSNQLCANGGTCKSIGISAFYCVCTDGFSGAACTIVLNPCDPNPCLNGAACSPSVGVQFTCTCLDGFTGVTCGDVIPCSSGPCLNGGTCIDLGLSAFFCQCPSGFAGPACEIVVDPCNPDPCQNGAICNPGQGLSFSCTCQPGFTGDLCNIVFDQCANNPCQNGATCFAGTGGIFFCNCVEGFTGAICDVEINNCDSTPCLNGATCINLVNAYVCLCDFGFTGTMCEDDFNECASSPCQNGGGCADAIGSFVCTCVAGWTGLMCEQVDDVPPVIACVGLDVTEAIPLNGFGTTVQFREPTATDNSGTANVQSRTHNPGQFFQSGTTQVTYVFIDPSGNTAECSFNIIITEVDRIPPTIASCPTSGVAVTVELGETSGPAFWQAITATDLSNVVDLVSQTNAPGDSFMLGTTTVMYIFADASGNRATCSFTVTVTPVDTLPPMISGCPGVIREIVELGSQGTIVLFPPPTATDFSGVATVTPSHRPGAFFQVGTTSVTYRFEDATGNSDECTFVINVVTEDTAAPECIGVPDNIVLTVELGMQGSMVTWVPPTCSDNGFAFVTGSTASPGTFFMVDPTGTLVTYTCTDNAGLSTDCSFLVVVTTEDTIAPMCQDVPVNTIGTVELGTGAETTVTWRPPTCVDLSPTTQTSSASPGDLFRIGTTTVTVTCFDSSGNNNSCDFIVTVLEVDNTAPQCLGVPAEVSAEVELGINTQRVSWIEPTCIDASGTAVRTSTSSPGSSFPVGVTPVTYTCTDVSGNVGTCSPFDVRVSEVDDTPPDVTCIQDIIRIVTNDSTGITVSWTEPTATDISGVVSLQSRSHAPGDFFSPGITQVTYIFGDPSGNTAFCIFTVTVTPEDNVPPVVSCIPDVADTTPLGTGGRLVFFSEPTATDDSGVVSLQQRTRSPGTFFSSGITQVTYIFVDPVGNTAECTFRVIVTEIDEAPPVIDCEGLDVSGTIPLKGFGTTVQFREPTATDNSGTANVQSRTHTPGQFFQSGTTQVTYVFIDPSGNTAECSFYIIIYEATELEIQLMDIIDTITRENTTTKEVVLASERIAEISDFEDFLEEDPQRIELVISSLESVVRAGEASIKVTDPAVRTIDNLMNLDRDILEDGMIEGGRAVAALEEQITNFQTNDGNFSTVLDNVGVNAVKIDARGVGSSLAYANILPENETLSIDGALQEGNTRLFSDGDAIPLERTTTSISVPTTVLDLLGGAGVELTAVPVTFIIYGNDVLFRPSMPTEVEENIEEEDKSTVTERIASQIISAIIPTENTSIVNLPPGSPVIATFLSNLNIGVKETIEAQDCVVWSYNENTGEGFWTKDGCKRMFHDNRDLTMCSCDRLGSFAILIRVRKGPVEAQVTLYYITLIGSIISGLALVGCLIIFVSLKSFRSKQPTHIHINLCISLLGFYIAFLLSPLAVGKEIHCTVASVFIHFFCLATLAWMSTEAMNMYYLFLKAERSTIRHFIPIACLLAYGLPAACALLVVFLDNSTDFQSASYCFIHPGYALYFGFLMEVGAMFVFNFIIFIWVIRKILCRPLMVSKTAEKAKRNEIIKRVRHAMLFWFVLGLSWIFGFFAAVDTKTLIFDYLYCFFISMQGILMFLLLCVANPAFKEKFKRTDSTQTKVTRQAKTRSLSSSQLGSSSQSNIPMDSMDNPSTSATE